MDQLQTLAAAARKAPEAAVDSAYTTCSLGCGRLQCGLAARAERLLEDSLTIDLASYTEPEPLQPLEPRHEAELDPEPELEVQYASSEVRRKPPPTHQHWMSERSSKKR